MPVPSLAAPPATSTATLSSISPASNMGYGTFKISSAAASRSPVLSLPSSSSSTSSSIFQYVDSAKLQSMINWANSLDSMTISGTIPGAAPRRKLPISEAGKMRKYFRESRKRQEKDEGWPLRLRGEFVGRRRKQEWEEGWALVMPGMPEGDVLDDFEMDRGKCRRCEVWGREVRAGVVKYKIERFVQEV